MKKIYIYCFVFVITAQVSSAVWAKNIIDRFQGNISQFTLDNGMSFLVVERHGAPVASFVTFVDVGGVDEPKGQSGIAHIFEHMAFKGTSRIGTKNWKKEKKILEKLDRAFTAWLESEFKPELYNKDKAQILRQRFEKLRDEAKQFVALVPPEKSGPPL